MEALFYLLFLAIGMFLGFLLRMFIQKKNVVSQEEWDILRSEKEKLTLNFQLKEKENIGWQDQVKVLDLERKALQERMEQMKHDAGSLNSQLTMMQQREQEWLQKFSEEHLLLVEEQKKYNGINSEKMRLEALLESLQNNYNELVEQKKEFIQREKQLVNEIQDIRKAHSAVEEKSKFLEEKLQNQKKEMEEIRENFNKEFQLIADKLLEQKSQKFAEQNQQNLKVLLDPLGKNIEDFKKQVQESYTNEGKERHTLAEKIRELTLLNETLSKEAHNLTQALKGNVKQQGNWGEMILESILQNSGLVKGEEYFTQSFIRDESGNSIIDENGKKLQPDVIIQLPDARQIVIDSKVSLLAYDKFVAAGDKETQDLAIAEHIRSLKNHIDGLSGKNYPKHLQSLDFTMMFIPIEPAYMIAMQHDPGLCEYPYSRRILLISPTNLIAALKLINDLWKREQQNRNAMEIAHRGAKLYDKFVGFIESMEKIGENIEKARNVHSDAMKQLSSGSGNLVGQVEKLKKLGISATKSIPTKLIESEDDIEL